MAGGPEGPGPGPGRRRAPCDRGVLPAEQAAQTTATTDATVTLHRIIRSLGLNPAKAGYGVPNAAPQIRSGEHAEEAMTPWAF